MIEVWEFLDCESVGSKEIIAISQAVREKFGGSAVDTPMRIARILADEGAELRHAEIMELDVEQRLESPYEPMFRNIINLSDLKATHQTIRQLENLRRKFQTEDDREGLRLVRELAIRGKTRAVQNAENEMLNSRKKLESAEIAEWLTIWLQSPEIFENWIELRKKSNDFQMRFGE